MVVVLIESRGNVFCDDGTRLAISCTKTGTTPEETGSVSTIMADAVEDSSAGLPAPIMVKNAPTYRLRQVTGPVTPITVYWVSVAALLSMVERLLVPRAQEKTFPPSV